MGLAGSLLVQQAQALGGFIRRISELPSLLLCGKTCFDKNLKSSPVGSMSCERTPTIVYFICLFVSFVGV